MQQECQSQTIMTSRRRAIFAPNAVRLPCLALVVLALAACAALPDDAPVVEQLDEETGLTITRLGRPLELYRDFLRRDAPGKFTFLAPFETNQMGTREPYLWLAIPLEDPEASVTPVVSVDGVRLDLPAPGRAPDAAGLRRSPYKVPMSWAATLVWPRRTSFMPAMTGCWSTRTPCLPIWWSAGERCSVSSSTFCSMI